METADVLFLALFLILPIALTIVAFKSKIAWIMFPVIVLWLLLAMHCHTRAIDQYDTYNLIQIMSIMMAVASGFMIFAVGSMGHKDTDLLGGNRDDIDIWYENRAKHRERIDKLKGTRSSS